MTAARIMDLSKESYYGGEVAHLSQSTAHTLLSQSPAHAHSRHPLLGAVANKPTDDMEMGTLIDSVLLGGDDSRIVVLPHEEFRTKEARADRDAVRAAGKVPVKQKHYEEAQVTAERIRDQLGELGIVLDGRSQVAIEWHEQASTGAPVLCRGTLDHWAADRCTIYDLKTCASAHPEAVVKSALRFDYPIQQAAYTSAIEHLRPGLAGYVKFVFLFVELEPPFAVLPCILPGIMRELGARKWRLAIDRWAECLRTGLWPGYGRADGPITLEPPGWIAAELERMGIDG